MQIHCLLAVALIASAACAQQPAQTAAPSSTSDAALTIYNEDFAVARTTIDLDLHTGINEVSTNQVTTQLEPDSVVLRDLSSGSSATKPSFRIVEQNYDAAVVTQDWLLQKYEGKTIDFAVGNFRLDDGKVVTGSTVQGKIIRAPRQGDPYGAYPQNQPLIEVDGKMQFQLPGTPLFPASTDGLLLKPTLRWQIDSAKAQKISAELAYITSGLNWNATYNVVTANSNDATGNSGAAEEKADLVGWVTITNRTGADFPQARIKLMAGDVAKIQPLNRIYATGRAMSAVMAANVAPNEVTQKAFDDFHLYNLNRTVSLDDGETKQVQFVEANGVTLTRSYVYDGAAEDRQPINYYGGQIIQQQNYGISSSNTKVQIVEAIKNTEANHLGIPLPAGRIRLYRRDADGQMEFVGESTINHTPAEDTIKVSTGSAFDVKGSRRQTDFYVDNNHHTLDEFFEIKLTNQKPDPVTVSVLEHLYRGDNWEVEQKSTDYTKLDSHTIEFPVKIPAKGEATVTYKVRYTW